MNRRTALIAVAGLTTLPPWATAQTNPYGPYGASNDYRILDLASVREVIVRLPKGNVTITTEDIWAALQKK